MKAKKQNEVLELIKARGYKAELTTVTKNGTQKAGVIIKREDEQVCPIVYLAPDIEDAEEEAERVLQLYEEHKKPKLDLEDFLNPEKIADNLRFGLQKSSEEKLVKKETIFEGIEQYLYIKTSMGDGALATAKLQPEFIEQQGLNEAGLWRLAYINTFKETEVCEIIGLTVITNSIKNKGAASILDAKALEKIAEETGAEEFWAIPSSIHEFLVLPVTGLFMTKEELDGLVKTVNETELEPEEILAHEAFKIRIENGEVVRA